MSTSILWLKKRKKGEGKDRSKRKRESRTLTLSAKRRNEKAKKKKRKKMNKIEGEREGQEISTWENWGEEKPREKKGDEIRRMGMVRLP